MKFRRWEGVTITRLQLVVSRCGYSLVVDMRSVGRFEIYYEGPVEKVNIFGRAVSNMNHCALDNTFGASIFVLLFDVSI